MLPLKLVRSLILGQPINTNSYTNHNHNHNMNQLFFNISSTQRQRRNRRKRKQTKTKTQSNYNEEGKDDDEEEEEEEEETRKEIKKSPAFVFMPSKELISNTYRLASLARDIGMDLHPTPSLSHIIFTYTSSSSSTWSSSSSSSSWSRTSLSSSLWSLPDEAVPLPFPSFTASSLALLRSFVSISKGLFKLVFVDSEFVVNDGNLALGSVVGDWNCCSLSLFSRVGCVRIDGMDGFSRALAGLGWSVFKTRNNSAAGDVSFGCGKKDLVYLFRKVDLDRVRLRKRDCGGDAGCRVRELRLPHLDFGNAPLRILQYILLMTDDTFYLA